MLLDQRDLPHRETWLRLASASAVAEAIRDMAVRGAPAIGIAAAYGLAIDAVMERDLSAAAKVLAASRPTAVNLFWAIDRIMNLPDRSPERVVAEAQTMEAEDEAMNAAIGEAGATLIPPGARILTICNTGSLATIGIGTALGIIRTAYSQGKVSEVFACETRPRLQGLRLTAWELAQEDIRHRMIPDSAAASLMRTQGIDVVIAGADRIARNGDSANKIGTFALACAARVHNVPFVIAAPSSTLDLEIANGDMIPIEERDATEITQIEGVRIAPDTTPVWNPGFDVTPADFISAIVMETGVHRPPFRFAGGNQ